MSEGSLIVGIGGTSSPGSSTETAVRLALAAAEATGAEIAFFGSADLMALPHYTPQAAAESVVARRLVEAIRRADGLIIGSPGYHGSISGLVKNAIDYLEETSKDERVYLDGVPVGLIVTAYGYQATGSTLGALRSIVHALRGWPTPMGVGIKSTSGLFKEGACSDAAIADQLKLVGRQVMHFSKLKQEALDLVAAGE